MTAGNWIALAGVILAFLAILAALWIARQSNDAAGRRLHEEFAQRLKEARFRDAQAVEVTKDPENDAGFVLRNGSRQQLCRPTLELQLFDDGSLVNAEPSGYEGWPIPPGGSVKFAATTNRPGAPRVTWTDESGDHTWESRNNEVRAR